MTVFMMVLMLFASVFSADAADYLQLHLNQPGTLGEVLGNKKHQITSLKLTGPINGDDIIVLRDMAGRYQSYQGTDSYGNPVNIPGYSEGQLESLDLSGAHIRAGGGMYAAVAYAAVEDGGETRSVNIATENDVVTNDMFRNLPKLCHLILPESAEKIGDQILYESESLKTLVIGPKVKEIGFYAFGLCLNLEEITVKSLIPPVPKDEDEKLVLEQFDNLHHCQLNIPDGTREVYKNAPIWKEFFDYHVVEVNINDEPGEIEQEIIDVEPGLLDSILGENRYNITSLKLRGELNADDIATLRDLMGVVVTETGDLTVTPGRLSELDLEEVTFVSSPEPFFFKVPGEGNMMVEPSFLFPDALPRGMFTDCTTLRSVVLPKTVRCIEDMSFAGNTSVVNVNTGEMVEIIGCRAFEGCTSLERFDIPSSTIHLGDRSFSQCSSLVEITIGENVETIGDMVFSGCTALRRITCKAIIPPVYGLPGIEEEGYDAGIFEGVDKENCLLVVSIGTRDAYAVAPYWSEFKNIIEEQFSGIIDIVTDSASEELKAIYNLQGTKQDRLSPGFNILRMRNGKVKKIMNR